MYDIAANSVYFEINHTDVIYGVKFVEASNLYFLILGQNGNYFVDTRNGMKYCFTSFDTTVFDTYMSRNQLYQCKNNTIYEYLFTFGSANSGNPNYTNNCTLPTSN